MIIPKLKRIKISSPTDLRNWLTKNSEDQQEVMIVTCSQRSRRKFVSRDDVLGALGEHGWTAGQSYTLIGDLVGHVARRA